MSGKWGIRYRPGTHLADRFGLSTVTKFDTEAEAEKIRGACVNAEFMETFSSETSR